ncbi:cyanoglobin [Paracoccus sp. (in: a-proteobacteria)]|uniref:globin domain-containing protein n=1 Tax=Paracoccus sp. TaxID=267 RepID=UPI0028992F4B|nr:cyanoglobin [Paracoccus sp. (in: a-proteobacteria)]
MARIDDIGGPERLHTLVNRFYDLIETDPRGADLLKLHFRGHGVAHARVEQVDFMLGFLGGRRTYQERHGHMNLREIHEHVAIRRQDAESWLALINHALDDLGHGGPEFDSLRTALRRAALVLVNRDDLEDGSRLTSS